MLVVKLLVPRPGDVRCELSAELDYSIITRTPKIRATQGWRTDLSLNNVGFQIEIPRWVEPRYKRTQYKNIQDTFGEKCHQKPQHHKETYDKMWGQRFGVGFRVASDRTNMYEHILWISAYDFYNLTVLISLQFIWILLDIQK